MTESVQPLPAPRRPIYIDGEGVGGEVTGQRDLPRVKTNKVREGMLLVVCEGLVLKAPKILKYVDALGLDGWEWLRPFAKGSAKGSDNKVKPNTKFISDVLAGRPVVALLDVPGVAEDAIPHVEVVVCPP